MCHLSSYSLHIFVMTFAVETAVDWLVFFSALSIFVTASMDQPLWFNKLNAAYFVIKMHET